MHGAATNVDPKLPSKSTPDKLTAAPLQVNKADTGRAELPSQASPLSYSSLCAWSNALPSSSTGPASDTAQVVAPRSTSPKLCPIVTPKQVSDPHCANSHVEGPIISDESSPTRLPNASADGSVVGAALDVPTISQDWKDELHAEETITETDVESEGFGDVNVDTDCIARPHIFASGLNDPQSRKRPASPIENSKSPKQSRWDTCPTTPRAIDPSAYKTDIRDQSNSQALNGGPFLRPSFETVPDFPIYPYMWNTRQKWTEEEISRVKQGDVFIAVCPEQALDPRAKLKVGEGMVPSRYGPMCIKARLVVAIRVDAFSKSLECVAAFTNSEAGLDKFSGQRLQRAKEVYWSLQDVTQQFVHESNHLCLRVHNCTATMRKTSYLYSLKTYPVPFTDALIPCGQVDHEDFDRLKSFRAVEFAREDEEYRRTRAPQPTTQHTAFGPTPNHANMVSKDGSSMTDNHITLGATGNRNMANLNSWKSDTGEIGAPSNWQMGMMSPSIGPIHSMGSGRAGLPPPPLYHAFRSLHEQPGDLRSPQPQVDATMHERSTLPSGSSQHGVPRFSFHRPPPPQQMYPFGDDPHSVSPWEFNFSPGTNRQVLCICHQEASILLTLSLLVNG